MEFEEIVIGEQIWATENLNVEHYRNGDLINDPSLDEGQFWCDFTTITRKIGRFCELKNSSDVSLTGKLYNWSALTDIRGLAPEGWRIPEVKDFQKLFDYYESIQKPYLSFEEYKKTLGFFQKSSARELYNYYRAFANIPKPVVCNMSEFKLKYSYERGCRYHWPNNGFRKNPYYRFWTLDGVRNLYGASVPACTFLNVNPVRNSFHEMNKVNGLSIRCIK